MECNILTKTEERNIFRNMELSYVNIMKIILRYPFIINSVFKVFLNIIGDNVKYERFINYILINGINRKEVNSLCDIYFYRKYSLTINDLFMKLISKFRSINLFIYCRENIINLKLISKILSMFVYTDNIFNYVIEEYEKNIKNLFSLTNDLLNPVICRCDNKFKLFVKRNLMSIDIVSISDLLKNILVFCGGYSSSILLVKKYLLIRKKFYYEVSYLISAHKKFLNYYNSYRVYKKRIVESNYRLIISVAKKYLNKGIPLEDLIQDGFIGLLKAIERFNYRKGFKFSTYSTWWIKQSISRSVSDKSRLIRLPVHVNDIINKVRKKNFNSSYYIKNYTGFNVSKLCSKILLTESKLENILEVSTSPISLEGSLNNDESYSLTDILGSDNKFCNNASLKKSDFKDAVKRALEYLPLRERKVIKMRFGIGRVKTKTLEEIGKEFGVTRERIRQIELKALERLNNPFVIRLFNSLVEGR